MLKSQALRFARTARALAYALVNSFGDAASLRQAPRRPTGAELRNPRDPHQAARIEAARRRREYRGIKAQAHYDRCILNNPCR